MFHPVKGHTGPEGNRGMAVLFHDLGTRWGGWSTSHPGRLYPRERTGTHCTGGWVGPRDGLDSCGKSLPPPGCDPRTFQPVESRCTYWAIPAHRPHSTLPKAQNYIGCSSQNSKNYEGWLISNAHSEISRKRDHLFKQTKVGSKVQNFSYKLTFLFFDIIALSFNTFFPISLTYHHNTIPC